MARSMDALAAMLKSSIAQSTQMAEKLLRAGVQQAVLDSSLGTRIDTSA